MELIPNIGLEVFMKTITRTSLFILWFGIFSTSFANEKVNALLAQDSAPEGVVFEIVSGDDDALKRAIPTVQRHSDNLRKKFPELAIAVVSHGSEQFALTRDNKKEYAEVHKGVQSLAKHSNITVHVCETYAGWQGLDAEAFPDYIDVAAAGPVQINDYQSLGYVLIRIDGSE